MTNFYEVKNVAANQWQEIHTALGIPVEALNGKHQQCPGCGGKDRFRYAKDSDGGWFCGQGGSTTGGDGFELLCHIQGLTKSEALRSVAQYLNFDNISTRYSPKRTGKPSHLRSVNNNTQRKQDTDTQLTSVQLEAQKNAEYLWGKSTSVIGHPYLQKKQIQPVEIRQYQGTLLIPMYFDGQLVNIHRIFSDGNKRFLKGGRVTGCYMTIGTVSDHVFICEGYATGCSYHENTGSTVVVAFNAGNLEPVTKVFRGRYPNVQITIAADNDIHTKNNPGLTKARQAALSVDGNIVYPDFSDIDGDGTDFNDYINAGGML